MVDAVFVGGGIIGLSAAYRAQQRGLEVLVLERSRAGSGASRVAAGVLAPDDAFGRHSLELYPDFVDELGDVGFWQCGLLDVTTGFFSEQDASIDPRRLVDALAARVPLCEGVEAAKIAHNCVTTTAG